MKISCWPFQLIISIYHFLKTLYIENIIIWRSKHAGIWLQSGCKLIRCIIVLSCVCRVYIVFLNHLLTDAGPWVFFLRANLSSLLFTMFSFVMFSQSSSFVPDHNGYFVTIIKEQQPVNQDYQMQRVL